MPFIHHEWHLVLEKALGIFDENSVTDCRRQPDLIHDTDLLRSDFSGL